VGTQTRPLAMAPRPPAQLAERATLAVNSLLIMRRALTLRAGWERLLPSSGLPRLMRLIQASRAATRRREHVRIWQPRGFWAPAPPVPRAGIADDLFFCARRR